VSRSCALDWSATAPPHSKCNRKAQEFTLDGHALCIKVREPKVTRKHAATVRLMKDVLGDADYRKITHSDIPKEVLSSSRPIWRV
jgi:hypothetical protein